jgi:hypothetical protein
MYKNEASSSRQSTHVKLPKKKTPAISNEHNISFKTFDASYVLTNKSGKVVAKYVGANTRVARLVFGYPRCLLKVAYRGVNRRKLKFINLKHNYKPGLALEIKSSPKERGKINQEIK